ncbi:MAG: DNA polymerase III, subunit gamma and tau [Ignavibacteria bacterium GWB2_35_12]|nr:MAG: DNA polymerase III, subunit gamma and tau [Ignavibacteria bacterium GWB2_35_12]OGU96077.1 MAG: DNA polymerase III, subunit gamma and tau [Ignavibacteria bacterium RIFOXYA2_FULL_35_10]OGV24450.1 MAG: DNA polymerase III, subunit gamma and tau [Ignavibacteria bacterium RIFOXYC2_FULL_35_21]
MTKDNQIQEYIVTARKWRPLKFNDVIGQEHITMTLKNAIRLNRNHHAYLFSGPRGIGKTTTARILARALNCSNLIDYEPCNECESCVSILEGRSMDVIEIDGASNNSVEDVKKIREYAKFTPVAGKYKIYIIDEVHMLSTSAFNALLKTLEEPPPHMIFIFATTEQHKVPATILSRCQRHNFKRIGIERISSHLSNIAKAENITIDEESLITIAKKGDGSMRDAQSIFDQVVAFCGNNIVYTEVSDALHLIDYEFFFRISRAIRKKNVKEMFGIADEVISKGYDIMECLGGLLEHFRNMLVIKVSENTRIIERSNAAVEKLKDEASYFSKADILRILSHIASAEQSLRYSPQPRIKFELALSQLASLDTAVEISTILDFINKNKSDSGILSSRVQKSYPILETASAKVEKKIINEPVEKYSKEKDNKTTEQIRQVPASGNIISSENLEAGWNEFVSKYGNKDTGFYLLNHMEMISPVFFNGEVILETNEKFIYDLLSKKTLNLEKLMKEFYGSEVNAKFSLGASQKITVDKDIKDNQKLNEEGNAGIEILGKPNSKGMAKPNNEDNNDNSDKSPIEKAIIDMFNAKEI